MSPPSSLTSALSTAAGAAYQLAASQLTSVVRLLLGVLSAIYTQLADEYRVLGTLVSIIGAPGTGVLGIPWYWPTNYPVSEYSIALPRSLRQVATLLGTLLEMAVIPVDRLLTPAWRDRVRSSCSFVYRVLFREQPALFSWPAGLWTGNDNEPGSRIAWIYVNGICTTRAVAALNARDLSQTFRGQQIHVVHNPTHSILVDLLECVRGQVHDDRYTQPAATTARLIRGWLVRSDVDEVRVIAHSQGTIVTGNAVRLLEDLASTPNSGFNSAHLKKLWVFNFANCYTQAASREQQDRTENFENSNDVVAQIRLPGVRAGLVFRREPMSGHLLGEHYLPGLREGLYRPVDGNAQSRLYDSMVYP